jgi:hypothetical protein
LEKQLQAWTPRRPSAELKELLFPKPVTAAEPPDRTLLWLRLAPAACAFLLVSCFWLARNDTESHLPLMAGNSNMLASLSLPCLASDGRCQEYNVLAVATFDWTKTGPSLSITGSFPLWKTNTQKL